MSLNDVDWTKIARPTDDGGAAHLAGMALPTVELSATDRSRVDLSSIAGRSIVYIYPMTGRPDQELPTGWDMIPGARGCTPQSCAFRDHFAELRALGVTSLFGLSVQDSDYQREAAQRLHLPFQLLSDPARSLGKAIGLPEMVVGGVTLYKRLTMVIDAGKITKVFYPVFPPDAHVGDVVAWLKKIPRT